MLTAALLVACGLTGPNAALMQRIVAVESGGAELAINVNGDWEVVRQPRDVSEAEAMARWLLEHGYNFDAGIAQVNSANFQRLDLAIEALFDACTNLGAGLQVLEECRERAVERFGEGERVEQAAISCYNTGDFNKGVRNGYVAAVQGKASGRAGRRAVVEVEPAESIQQESKAVAGVDVFEEAAGRRRRQ